jgi:sialidase-1
MKKEFFPKGQSYALFLLVLFAGAVSCTRNVAPAPTEPAATDLEHTTDAAAAAAPYHNTMVLFNGGSEGYHSFRIPSIVRCNSGTLIAFAEGRMSSNKDYGNINLVYKRSTNNGSTWGHCRK